MSNARILIICVGIIVASLVSFVAMPRQKVQAPTLPEPATSGRGPGPRVMSFAELYGSLTAEEKACVAKATPAGRIQVLQQGRETVTDAELDLLNACLD